MGTAARTAFRCVTQAGVLATLALLHAQALADACVDVTSAAAVPVEEFKLCEHSVDDKAETYACREYRDTDSRYVLLFKGGPRPKAILKQEISGGVAEPRAVRRSTTPPSTCRQSPPKGVPAIAIYRGTGVCLDNFDRSVPCSVYEHAAARDPRLMRYMVFYHPDGQGPIEIDAQMTGENGDALLAEFAFQLGLGLFNAGCCQEQAETYLGYAHQLFPDEPVYRAAYHEAVANPPSDATARGHITKRLSPALGAGDERGATDSRF